MKDYLEMMGQFSLLSIALVWSGPTREKVSRHRLRIAVGSRRSPSCSSVENDGPTPPSKGLLQADDVCPMSLAEIDCFLSTVLQKERSPRCRERNEVRKGAGGGERRRKKEKRKRMDKTEIQVLIYIVVTPTIKYRFYNTTTRINKFYDILENKPTVLVIFSLATFVKRLT